MTQEAAFRRVRENFQRVEQFGWVCPSGSWPNKFKAWPKAKGKCLNGLGYRQAAVLFLMSYHRGELHVLITKRSHLVSAHKGMFNAQDKDHMKNFQTFGMVKRDTIPDY